MEALPVASGIVKAHNPFIAAAASLWPRTALHAIKDQAPGSEAIAPTSTGSPKAVPVPWASLSSSPSGAAAASERRQPCAAEAIPCVWEAAPVVTECAPRGPGRVRRGCHDAIGDVGAVS